MTGEPSADPARLRRRLERERKARLETESIAETALRELYEKQQALLASTEERRRVEERLRQSQKMEAVGQLAGGIAHDFNNLLTVILGFGHMVRGGLGPEHPQTSSVDQMIRAGDRAADLVNQLLAFGRRQMLQVENVDLGEVVGAVTPMLRRLIGENIDLASSSAKTLGTIRADRGQIEQVVMNLVVNARDAMPDGGKVTIQTLDVELDANFAATHPDVRPGAYVLLSVTDTGVGMDAATRDHLFEPFFTTKELGRGTGLGLATVYGIVRQSDGHIVVYSEPGRGTAMKCYFPRTGAPASDQAASPDADETCRGTETVLLVEDELGVRLFAAAVLADLGYRVLEAEDGESALAVARAHGSRIDVVLTDVVMPHMGGRKLVENLAVERPGTKAVYMSGYTSDAVVRHGILEHEADFLSKPFTPGALSRKVRDVLDRGRATAAPAAK
jgi:two-component system cell cycle sensor histidine kinase/response regulator CckA